MEIWLQRRVIEEMEIEPWICICAYGHDDLVRSADANGSMLSSRFYTYA